MIEARVEHMDPETSRVRADARAVLKDAGGLRDPLHVDAEPFARAKRYASRVFLTDPATTPEAEAMWELQTAVEGDASGSAPDETDCGVKRIESHDEAVTLYRGPYELMEPTYRELTAWIAENGYTIVGPPAEVYLSDQAGTAPKDHLTEVRFPVRAG